MSSLAINNSNQPLSSDIKPLLISELSKFIAEDRILTRLEQLKPFECDGLSAYTQLPMVVISVINTQEVQEILKFCYQHNVPIVPRGSGTGLSGGALPHPFGVTLNFSKMNQILEVDADNRCAIVQAGVRNISISEAANPYGLFFAPDPSSQTACSIGGNVAENSGGLHCLKYGLTVNNVLGVKMILADGTLIELGGKQLSQPSLDLLSLVIGSEGLLGVVTEVIVKLIPKPFNEKVLLAGFNNVSETADCVSSIISSGILPAALEMMDNFALKAVERFTQSNLPIECAAVLLCEVDGTKEEIDEQMNIVIEICKRFNATHTKVSQTEEERQKLWLGRKSAFPAMAMYEPDYYCLDGTIPRRFLGQVLDRIATLSKKFGLKVANVFHAGDGNMHPLILYNAKNEGELEKCEALGAAILQTCLYFGGTISGEHGIGVEKIDTMCEQFTFHELQQFFDIKSSFDVLGIMNPGKNIPTLTRCGEIKGTHQHHAKPNNFADIPIF